MAHKLSFALMGLVLAAAPMAWSAEEKKIEDTAQIVERMETHWRTLVKERDPARRKALIAEHRRMMAEARTALDAAPGDPGRDGIMGSHHLHDLQNTTELHSMMLDMML